jgi:flagellar biosynthetic protein FliR
MRAAPDLGTLGISMAIELMIGVAMGLMASMPLYAAQLSGQLIDHQIGLGLGSVYNPLLDSEGTTVGELLMYIAMATFLAIGGLDALYFGVVQTYTYLPLGEAQAMASPLDAIVGLISAGLELALRVAAPVLCVIMLETVASAFLMKTMPQMNVMSIGFAIKILLGFFVLVMSLKATNTAIASSVEEGVNVVFRWIHAH